MNAELTVDMCAALLCGILTGMGVGSGGLFMIFLLMVRKLPQLTAQGLNLLFFLFSAGASLPVNVKKRRPDFSVLWVICVFGAAGAFFGSRAGEALDPGLLRKLFGAFIISAGAVGLFSPKKSTAEGKKKKRS